MTTIAPVGVGGAGRSSRIAVQAFNQSEALTALRDGSGVGERPLTETNIIGLPAGRALTANRLRNGLALNTWSVTAAPLVLAPDAAVPDQAGDSVASS